MWLARSSVSPLDCPGAPGSLSSLIARLQPRPPCAARGHTCPRCPARLAGSALSSHPPNSSLSSKVSLGPSCFFILGFLLLYSFVRQHIFIFKIFIYLAAPVLVAACMRDLVPQPGLGPGPPALGAQSLNHWTTREVPGNVSLNESYNCAWVKS